jgi:hypothetical protein
MKKPPRANQDWAHPIRNVATARYLYPAQPEDNVKAG